MRGRKDAEPTARSAAAPGRNPLHSQPPHSRGWHSRGYLPHFDSTTVIQFVTYRLADAVPRHVAIRLADELAPDAEPRYRRRIEQFLDAGQGKCLLRQPPIANIIMEHWFAREAIDYHLHAWVIMPNHVHVVVAPIGENSLSRIIGAWKSITARRIRKAISGESSIWQADYWDRFIRDEEHYRQTIEYVRSNPVIARLVRVAEDWPWSSASERHAAGGGRAPGGLPASSHDA